MKTAKTKGIKAGIICFSVFMVPWFGFTLLALVTDFHGFNGESIAGIIVGIIVFAFVSTVLGFSIAKKSVFLIILASLVVAAVPILWVMMPWLP
jgi:hypothetical protein